MKYSVTALRDVRLTVRFGTLDVTAKLAQGVAMQINELVTIFPDGGEPVNSPTMPKDGEPEKDILGFLLVRRL